jgi:ribosomal protein S18 acetylase RimI-like enzyme
VEPEQVERLDPADLAPGVLVLLLAAAGPAATTAAVREPYLRGATLLGARRGSRAIGVLGLDAGRGSTTTILALAVDDAYRRQGLGRALVHAALIHTSLPLVAETDSDAVGFYRACGFDVADLGERPPGVRRFRCVLARTSDGQGSRSHRSR